MSEVDVKLLTYREVAEVLQVSERTVWGLVKEGVLRAVRIGRQVRITLKALKEFIERQQGAGE